jgi:hypothetical protein
MRSSRPSEGGWEVRRWRAGSILVAALSLFAAAAAAQPWRGTASLGLQVSGKGGGLAGARVDLRYRGAGEGGPSPVLTDGRGRAAFVGLAAGSWNVEVSHPGHLSWVAAVTLDPSGKAAIDASFLQATGEGRETIKVKLFRASAAEGTPAGPPLEPVRRPAPPAAETPPPAEPRALPEATPESIPEPIPEPESMFAPEPEPEPMPEPEPAPAPTPQTAPPRPREPERASEPMPERERTPAPEPEPETAPAPMPETAPVPMPEPAPAPMPETAPVPMPEPAPKPEVAVAPPAATPEASAVDEPTPSVAPAPTRPPSPLVPAPPARSFANRTCAECKPGEWAAAAEVVVDGAGACPSGTSPSLAAALRQFADRDEIGAFAGQAFGAVQPTAAERVPAAVREALSAATRIPPGCGLAAVALPARARFVGFRYEAFDGRESGDCLAGEECPVAGAFWPAVPGIVRGAGSTLIWAWFENHAEGRSREGRLTAYYVPASAP